MGVVKSRTVELTTFEKMLLPFISEESVTGTMGGDDTSKHIAGQLVLNQMPGIHKFSTGMILMFPSPARH